MASDTAFTGSVPEMYEQILVPMIFAEPARQLASAIAAINPTDVLETAAGTGALTREMDAVGTMTIIATDLNEAMLQKAEALGSSERVRWEAANALDLPFPDETFDAVACQFGVMFFPDKVAGYAEALRVLRPAGLFAFNVWDRIETNEVAHVVTDALLAARPGAALEFLRRTPHGHHDADRIRVELEGAGFVDIEIAYGDGVSRTTASDGALAYCQGTPLRGEIEQSPDLTLDEATSIAAHALRERYGDRTFDAPTRWLQVTARRPHA